VYANSRTHPANYHGSRLRPTLDSTHTFAARLSEDPDARVALVEAGGVDDAPEISMPAAFPQLFKTKYDWDFATEPERYLAGRRIYLLRGRTLGGSSGINAMVYIRGNAADYDDWAGATGAAGWSYREMLPYFIRSECNEQGDPRYHGHLGPLAVQDSRSRHPLVARLINAGIESGYHPNDDFNGSSQMGVGWINLPNATASGAAVRLPIFIQYSDGRTCIFTQTTRC